jgi:hypothetical protein
MLAVQPAAPVAAPLHIAPAPTESRLLTRLRLPRATAAALVMLLDGVCSEPEPRPEPEGQTLRPDPHRGRAPQEL